MISASPTILAVETDSAWAVVLVVSLVTLPTVLLLRRLIDRPGGVAAGILLTLPLVLPLAAALVYRHSVLPEIGVLRPAASALLERKASGDLDHLLLLRDESSDVFIPYALSGSVRSWIVIIGVAVSSIMLVRRLAGTIAMRRVVARCTPVEDTEERGLASVAERLAASAGLRRAPRVLILAPGMHGAFARGLRGGQILVSRDLVEDLDPDELEGILAHELAHLHALDTVLTFVAGLARDLVAWNPVAHLAFRRLNVDRELEADRRAAELTGNPLAVASGLVKTCDLLRRRGLQALTPSVLLGFGSGGRPIGRRVVRLLALADGSLPSSASSSRSGVPFMAAAALAAVLAVHSAGALVSNEEGLAVVWGRRDATPREKIWSPPPRALWSKARLADNASATRRADRADRKKIEAPIRPRVYYQELKSAQAVAEDDLATWMMTVKQLANRSGEVKVFRWDARGWDVRPLFSSADSSFGVYRLKETSLSPRGAL